jgi:MFS transporter, ACS family, allantoate permease
MGIRQARHITLSEYSWLSSIFCAFFFTSELYFRAQLGSHILDFGYLVGEFPSSYCLARLPLGKWTAFTVSVWGAVLCCMAVAPDFKSLMVVRL